MRGHIKKRATWEYVAELGPQPLQRCAACHKRYWIRGERLKSCPLCHGPLQETIKRRQEMKAGFPSRREAEDALTKVLASLSAGTYIEPSHLRLSQFLTDEWLPAVRSTIRPNTYLSYQGHVKCHIIPHLGSMTLQQLQAPHINAFYSRLLTEGRGKGKPGLSPGTVRRVHATLHKALRDAVRWNRLMRNPVDFADPPRLGMAQTEMKVWNASQLKNFLAHERESRLYALWLVLATTGMRRGEALGLSWTDLDLEAGRVSITKTRVMLGYAAHLSEPKTRRGRRMIALDPATAASLKEHRHRQKEEHLALGPKWKDSGYVFTKEDGEPLHPERVTRLFRSASKKAALPPIRLHDLRHSYASLALAAGVHVKIISERLGHASTAFTMDVYAHSIPALSEEAATQVAAMVLPD